VSRFKVVVPEDRFHNYETECAMLAEVDASLDVHDCRSAEDLRSAVAEADGILLNEMRISANVIDGMRRCRVISRYGIGYDNVDVAAATQARIWVAHVPDYGAEGPVADQALALLLGCIRRIAYKNQRVREGGWNLKDEQPCHKIEGRNLGLIGYGKTAAMLHRKCSGLGLGRVLAWDPYVDPERIRLSGAVPTEKEMLLQESDYISIHVPLNDETRDLIGNREFSIMKKGAILINTSRGSVVNEPALIEALEARSIDSAGLDVFSREPLPVDSPLKKLDNVILSDHCGFYCEETIAVLQKKATQNVVEVLRGHKPVHPVNQLEP
jgi:D-3-phosphoglycerate dehydrogenase / 2-oxoglutarate reductase